MMGRWHNILVVLVSFATVLLIPSCGKDDGAGPGGGNGGGEKTILSAASSDGWTVDLFIQEATGANCAQNTHHVYNIGEVWVPGGFSVVTQSRTGNNCCDWQTKNSTLTSKRFDLAGYKAARLKGRLRMYAERYVWSDTQRGEVRLHLYSNTPASPNLLNVVRESFYAVPPGETFIEKDIDISLENALGYDEASVELKIDVNGGCGQSGNTFLWNKVSIELLDFRIVGTK